MNLKTKSKPVKKLPQKKIYILPLLRKLVVGLSLSLLMFYFGYQTGSGAYSNSNNNPLTLSIGENNNTGITVDRFVSNQRNPDFNLYWEVWDKLKTQYIDHDELSEKEMLYSSIKGLVSATDDPYTVFLTPDENKRSKDDLKGAFEGVGIQLGYKEYLGQNRLAVITPLDGNPAIKAGVKAGDLILGIDGKDTEEMSLPEAVDLIRGEKGTQVTLALLSEDETEPHDISITRGTIKVPSVTLTWLKSSDSQNLNDSQFIAHIKVSRFGQQTTPEWNNKVREILNRSNESEFKGIILDLRGNPGGFFNGAIELGSDLVTSGVIVQQENYIGEREQFRANGSARLVDIPLVILVNKGSASASEILAGAVRDLRGTKLVGDQTFGKGSVQEAIDLENNTGLHITTYRWLLPSGSWIHHEGIPVDIEIELDNDNPDTDEQLEAAIKELL